MNTSKWTFFCSTLPTGQQAIPSGIALDKGVKTRAICSAGRNASGMYIGFTKELELTLLI